MNQVTFKLKLQKGRQKNRTQTRSDERKLAGYEVTAATRLTDEQVGNSGPTTKPWRIGTEVYGDRDILPLQF